MRKLVLIVLVLCFLATLSTVTGADDKKRPRAGKERERPDRDDRKPPGGGEKKPSGGHDRDSQEADKKPQGKGPCDPNKIKENANAVKALLSRIKAENVTLTEILSVGKKTLPRSCRNHLIRKVSSMRKKKCDSKKNEAEKAICDNKADPEFLRAFVPCIEKKNRCDVLERSATHECVGREDWMEKIAEIGVQMSRSYCNMPTNITLGLPSRKLQEYLRDNLRDGENIKKFLNSIDEDALAKLDCERKEIIMYSLEKRAATVMKEAVKNNQWMNWIHFIPHMPQGLCARLPAVALKEIVASLKDKAPIGCGLKQKMMPYQSRGKAYERKKTGKCEEPTCTKQILNRLKKMNQLQISNAAQIEKLRNLSSCLSSWELLAAAKPGNCKMLPPQAIRGRSACASTFKVCMPKDFGARNLSEEDIVNIGPIFFNCIGDRDMRTSLPKHILCSTEVTAVLEKARDSRVKEKVARKCQGDREISKDDVLKRGARTVTGLPVQAWKKTKLDTIKAILPDIKNAVRDISRKEKKKIAATLRTIAKKALEQAKKDGNLKRLTDSKTMMVYISKKDFEQIIQDKDVETMLGLGDDGTDIRGLTASQTQIVIARLKKKKPVSHMKEEYIRKLKELVRGLPSGDIANLQPDDKLLLCRILAKKGPWPCKKAKFIWKLCKEGLKNVNDTNPVAALSDSDVDSMDASALFDVGENDLGDAKESVCLVICKKLGNSLRFLTCQTRKYRKRILKACRKCLKKEAVNAEISRGDLTILAGLAVLDGSTVQYAKPESVLAACSALRATCPNKEALEKITAKLNEAFSGKEKKEIDGPIALACGWFLSLGSATTFASRIAVANNPDADLSGSGDDDADDDEDDRATTCKKDATAADKAATKAQEFQYKTIIVAGVKAQASEVAKTTRRRRATNPYSCADLKAMGAAVSAVSADDIKAMTSNEILNCIATLGSVKFSDSLKTAVVNKMKAALGNLCSLTSDQISVLGSNAYSLLTLEVIKCLDLKTDEAVSGLSYLSEWSTSQLTALAKRFRETRSNLAPGAIMSDHLTVLNQLTCGLTLEEIKQIPAAQFSAVSSMLGKLSKPPAHCLQGLVHLAKQTGAYGAVNTWTPATYSDLGIIIAGLDGAELNTASESAIESWSTKAISSMSAAQLEKLDLAKLQSFGRDQAAAVPDETRQKLNIAKQNALLTARDGKDATLVKPANMATMKHASLFGVAVTLLGACIF